MEKHKIIIGSQGYQRVSDDLSTSEITLDAKFHYSDERNITSADFKLQNFNRIANWYFIDKVLYCSDERRIEVHVCSHHTVKDEFSEKRNVTLNGLTLGNQESAKLIFRVSSDATSSQKKECQDGISGTPDDKDGSILIGVRTVSNRFISN